MSNTDQPADLESIFKHERIPHSTYELFKTVVTVGICTGVEALTLFHAALIPSLIFRREEGNRIIEKRVFKDHYGNILVIPEEDHRGPCENGYELLQQYLFENCFTYSFYAPNGAKINEAVLIPSEQSNCWALTTGTWERNLDTGAPATYTREQNDAPISQDFLQAIIEIIKEAAAKATYETIRLAHSQVKPEEKEETSEPKMVLAPLTYPLNFKEAMTAICSEPEDKVIVSKVSGFAYGFTPTHQFYAIDSAGQEYESGEMGIEDNEIAGRWELLPHKTFMVYAVAGKIQLGYEED